MSWQIGVSTGAWVGDDIGGALDAIEQASFQAVEVGTPPGHFDPWNLDQVQAVGRRMAASGILPISIHAPFGGLLDLSDPNPHHRHAAVGAILTAASALHELGGSVVVVHATDVPRDGQDVGRRLADCATSLSVLAEACTHMDMTMAVENPLPHLIGGQPDELRWILEQMGDGARVCLDTSHATLGRRWEDLFGVVGERVIHVHANDHRGSADEHLAPGMGVIPWSMVGEDLRRVGFRGWLILELNRELSGSASELARARARLLSMLDGSPDGAGA